MTLVSRIEEWDDADARLFLGGKARGEAGDGIFVPKGIRTFLGRVDTLEEALTVLAVNPLDTVQLDGVHSDAFDHSAAVDLRSLTVAATTGDGKPAP